MNFGRFRVTQTYGGELGGDNQFGRAVLAFDTIRIWIAEMFE